MLENFYLNLEEIFGLDINTILSGIGITAGVLIVYIIKTLWVFFNKKDSNYTPPSIIDVKKDIIDSEIEGIDVGGAPVQVFNIGGSVKNSSIKKVKIRDHE